MNEQQQPTENTNRVESEEPPPYIVAPAPRHNSFVTAFSRMNLTQMTLVVLVVIFLWQWFDGHRAIGDMQQQLAKKIAEMDGVSKANQVLLTQSQGEVRELSAKVATLETRYAEAQNQRAALEALYNDLSVSRDETALAEVEQMLLIAGQQLQLSANVKAALIAMQSADTRLQRMDRPAFNGLRKAIGQDMDKLRALPSVDITGINLQLDNLIGAVDELPLVYQQRAAKKEEAVQTATPKNETAWQKLLREIWQDAKQLVRIEDTGKAEIPLLPPNQEFFLRENLKLRLLSARLALLSRDEDGFRQELKTAQLWATRYFDGKSNEVMRMLAALKKIAASPVSIELPDVSPSLQAVRNYRLTHEHAADRIPAKKTVR
ncbi:MAG TPA: uroporphyrinogen-III C-methyltransferase [Gallionella sp.]|nr:uroporphyrinogen-III C-methyltransferase [Gallionella sp.]